MVTVAALLEAIDRFLREANMAESTFGRRAVNDGKFVSRLREGGDVTLATARRVECFILESRAGEHRKFPS